MNETKLTSEHRTHLQSRVFWVEVHTRSVDVVDDNGEKLISANIYNLHLQFISFIARRVCFIHETIHSLHIGTSASTIQWYTNVERTNE